MNAAAARTGGTNPWLVAIVVSIATFMEVLDTTIANVALRYISGGLAVGPDEAAWVVTSYLVANAIVLCASGWMATVFGRKRFFMVCIGIFTVASVLCGFAWSLDSLLFFRVLQGLGGGGMAPVSQSILADSFPPEKRGQAFALYGVAVVVAPVVGPTLGGWLSDNYSWHWCFLINAPVGLLALGLIHVLVKETDKERRDRAELRRKGLRFDLVGFLLVASFLGALEVTLDQGQREDWFDSTFIRVFAAISVLSLALFIPWEMTRRQPLIDLKMLFSRQFGACFLVMLATGAILISTTQFVPQLLQEYFGYTATWAGLALSPGGVVTMAMMFVVGRLSGVVSPKWLIAAGATIIALSMWHLTNLYAGLDFGFFAWSRVYIGIGLPLIFIPITNASYQGLPKDRTDQASALINMARNIGGSMGVSLSQTVLAQRQQFHQSRLVENVVPSDPQYVETLRQVTDYFVAAGSSMAQAKGQAIAWIGQQVATQSALLAYVDVFAVLALLSASAVPLALILRGGTGKAPAGAH